MSSIEEKDFSGKEEVIDINDNRQDLPSPAVAQVQKSKPKLSATMIIPIWIVLSSSVIIYNNYLYNTLSFKYPVFLVTWHLTFAVRVLLLVGCTCGLIILAGYWHKSSSEDNHSR